MLSSCSGDITAIGAHSATLRPTSHGLGADHHAPGDCWHYCRDHLHLPCNCRIAIAMCACTLRVLLVRPTRARYMRRALHTGNAQNCPKCRGAAGSARLPSHTRHTNKQQRRTHATLAEAAHGNMRLAQHVQHVPRVYSVCVQCTVLCQLQLRQRGYNSSAARARRPARGRERSRTGGQEGGGPNLPVVQQQQTQQGSQPPAASPQRSTAPTPTPCHTHRRRVFVTYAF